MTLLPKNLPKTSTPFLSWLFKAEFANGFIVQQDMADTCRSRTDGTGSAFSDVMAATEQNGKLTFFALEHTDGLQMIGVDLKSGNFIVNGTPVCAHNQNFDPAKYELELIYFRETRVEQDMKATVLDDGNVKQEATGELRHFVNRYFIGWQTQVHGKNKQVTIAVG